MNLSQHFTLAEFTRTSTPLPNVPDEAAVAGLVALCVEVLEPLRAALGAPIRITSGFRSREVNSVIRGSPTSAHCFGLAADVKSAAGDAEHILRVLHQLDLDELDQAIGYAVNQGGHVHVGLSRPGRVPRRQFLWKDSAGYAPWSPR